MSVDANRAYTLAYVDADVVVVGAGLSGLACAKKLADAGVGVRVLEARDRVGGRTHSVAFGRGTFDLGGQWVGPRHRRTLELARSLGEPLFFTHHEGRKVFAGTARTSTHAFAIPWSSPLDLLAHARMFLRLVRLGRGVPPDEPWRARDAAQLDAQSAEALTRGATPMARAAFDAAVRTVWGAEPRELSLLYFLAYQRAGGGFLHLVGVRGGAQERRLVNGAQALSLGVARMLAPHVVLGSPVRRIVTRSREVEVVTATETHAARLVVLALPAPMAARIDIKPALPAPLTRLGTMGAAIKCLALYEAPFWREKGLSGEVVFENGPVSVAFDNTSHDGKQAALVAFVVGDPARRLGASSERDRRHRVLRALAGAFGPQARHPSDYVEHDWSADPWSRGCPVALLPSGMLPTWGPSLRAPVGRLHFAGTETARAFPGYLEGALEAGERAASEVLERLERLE